MALRSRPARPARALLLRCLSWFGALTFAGWLAVGGTGAAELSPLFLETPLGQHGPEIGHYSERTVVAAVEIDRLTPFTMPDGQSVPAVQVPWPDKLQEIQRRVYYRAEVPPGRRIETCMWDGGICDRDEADLQHMPHHTGLLQDVSGGGCRVEIDATRDPLLRAGDTVGIEFQPDPRSEALRLDAMFRHADDLGGGKLSLGFQFVGLEMTAQGRATLQGLSRVVSTFLRIQARRKNKRFTKNHNRRR